MKNIAFFSIPAHGHTNPMLPVASELVKRGNRVRFYSFNAFQEKIAATGAEFISCDSFLPEVNKRQEENLKKVSTTEMTIQDIRITLKMDEFLSKEMSKFKIDVIYTDSVCFWGKLIAWKFDIPIVVSTSTFAFNQLSSQYMKNSPAELADMIFGLPRISKELKTLEPHGYHVKNALSLVQSDNNTDSVVYTSHRFQPYADSFSEKYAFVGPSVFSMLAPQKEKERPLIYISMGTIINDKPHFYKNCIDALGGKALDVIISCGNAVNIEELGILPENIKMYPYVNQLEVLSRADVFITHCGMNSVSESLYMATPMVLYPQTGEQHAVARRAKEIGAGLFLKDDSSDSIYHSVKEILSKLDFSKAALECSKDFRSCTGPSGAAKFIENAPHKATENKVMAELNKKCGLFRIGYWAVAVLLIILFGTFISWKYVWIIGVSMGILSTPIGKAAQNKIYQRLTKK